MGEVIASYNRIRHQGLPERFYERFLAADHRARQAFAHTNFETQNKLFTHGLLMLLQYGSEKTVGKLALRRLSETHGEEGMNVAHDLYPIWVKSLVDTVAELDPEFTPTLGQAWHNSLSKGIAAMMHCPHASRAASAMSLA